MMSDHFVLKVIDFGVSRIKKDDKDLKMTVIGTPVWMAPEVLRADTYSYEADVYSFVLVLWSLLTRKSPYDNIHQLQLATAITVENFREEIPEEIHPTIKDIIKRGWDNDPKQRPTFDEIIDLLLNIINPYTKVSYVSPQEAIPDDYFLKVAKYLSPQQIGSLGVCSKRYYSLFGDEITEHQLSLLSESSRKKKKNTENFVEL